MPFRRVPGRVKEFKEWANKEINNSQLSDSATPSNNVSRGTVARQKTRFRSRKLLRRRRKRRTNGSQD